MRIIRNNGRSHYLHLEDIAGSGADGPDLNYTHDQAIASAVWTITHNLGKNPSVTVVTSAGDEVEGTTHYIDSNTLEVTFSAPFGGKAYLN